MHANVLRNIPFRKAAICFIFCITVFTGGRVSAQPCASSVPSFTIDLTGHPDSVWTSSAVVRDGTCCTATHPDNCIEFIVTLDSNTEGIKLDLCSGAVPSGSMFFQISCGGAYPVGQPVCMSGVGPHRITFCKPGNNTNQYCITAIPKPNVSPDVIVAQACTQQLYVSGLVEDSITWRSYPQVAQYDSFLSCRAGCDSVTVTPSGSFPNYVDYIVHGLIDGGCSNSYFTDTVRVYLVTTLGVEILPSNARVCYGDTSIPLTARPVGGLAPYTFVWSTAETDSVIEVVPGTYTVELKDSLGCYTARDTMVVGVDTVALKAYAGNDTSICSALNAVKLNGRVTGVPGGRWIGGGGRFIPDSLTLNATYVPSQAEINAGSTSLRLVTRGSFTSCYTDHDTDTVAITIYPAPEPSISGQMQLCEYTKGVIYSSPFHSGNSWSWHVVGGKIKSGQGSNSITVDWDSAGPGYIYVIETSPEGCQGIASINTISRFDFNTNPLTDATIGPDAVSTDTAAYSSGIGYQITYNCSGSKGADLSVPGSVFDRGKMCMTFSFQRDENEAEFFTRGGTKFYLTGGRLTIVMRISNGVGGFTDVGPLNTGYQLPSDDVFRFYTFCYDSATGIARVLVNDSLLWNYQASPGRSLYWTGAGNALMATIMDGSCQGKPLLDFSNISIPISITRTPRPFISGPTPRCEFTGTHTYSTPVDTNSSTYAWSISGGTIVSGQGTRSIGVRWGAAGTGLLTLTQTYTNGCDSTDTMSVTINPKPHPVVTGQDSVCQNTTYSYSVTPVAGNTYAWVATGGTIQGSSTGSSVNVRWGSAGTGNIRVTQTNTFGCDSVMNNPVVIVSKPTPVISGPATACQNHSYIYSVTAVAGHTYAWQATGGTIQGSATGSSVVVLWGASGIRSLSVTQTRVSGCDSTVNLSVTVRPTPAPVISGPPVECQNKLYTYSVTAVVGNTYSWSANGGIIQGSSTGSSVNIRWSPGNIGMVTVTQTNTFGCDSTVRDTVIIYPTPAPVITGPDTACLNRVSTYSVTSTLGHTYSWSVSGGTIQGSSLGNSVDIRWNATGARSVSVTETSLMGCDSSISKPVIVMPTPAPAIIGPATACQSNIYTYSVIPTAGHTYSWSAPGGTVLGSSTSNTVQILWSAPGGYTVTVTQTSASHCDSGISLSVTVNPTPAPVISGPDSTCQNKLYSYSVPAVAGHTYSWNVIGGVIQGSGTSSSVNVRWGAAGMGVVSVTQTNTFSCDSIVHDTVVIMPTPAPVIAGPDSTCQNKAYNYSVTPVAGSTYSWSVSGGAIQGSNTGSTVNIRWAAPGQGVVTITQTSAFGCDSSVNDTVVIMPTPAPVISGPDSICQNKAYNYSVTPVAGSTYSWSVSGGAAEGSNTGSTVSIRWDSPGQGVVTVTQTSAFGCDSTVMDTVTIVSTPAPVISGPDSTCQNKAYNYSITPVAGHTYSWSVNGGAIQGANTGSTVNVRWAMPGQGIVTVTQSSAFGCDSTVHDTVVIMPTPAPVISGPDSTCENNAYNYSVTPVAGSTYSWSVTGGSIEGANNNSSVQIRWSSPGTGIITLTQTSDFGCDSLVRDTVVVMPLPVPVISGPDSTCRNKRYTYSVAAVSGHTYSWSVSGGTIEGSNTSNTVNIRWAAPGTGSVTVTQTSDFGCDSTVSLDGIVIMPTPAPVVSGPDSTCQNKAYNYSVTPVAGSTYSWSVSGGTIQGSNTGSTVNIRWAAPGQGVVTITQTSAFGCDSTVHDTVVIMPTPAPVVSGPDSACQNKAYNYSVTPVAGSTYSWSVSGGAIEGSNAGSTVSIRWAAPGQGIITITYTSSFGCDSTVMDTVTIVPTPAPVISGPDSTCQNKAYNYSVAAVTGHAYSWSVSGGAIQGSNTGSTVSIRWAAPGAGVVTITQTSGFGCDSTVMDTVTIVPTPAPVINGPDSTCQNKRYTYSVAAVSGHTYSWSVNGGTIEGSNTSNTVNIRWAAPGNGSVTVTQTSGFGCDSTVSLAIDILPTPAPVISGSDSTCQNKRYTYSVAAVSGHTYSWSVSGGAIEGSATSNTVNIRWAAPGTGSVTVTQTSGFGCDSTISLDSVVIMPTPAPVISGPDSVCQNRRYTYSVPSVSGHTYSWSVSGGTIEGASVSNTVDIRWAAPGAGIVTVTQASAFGCDSIVHDTVVIMPAPAPVISGADSVCQNKQYTYSTPAVAGHTYSWSVSGGTIEGPATSNTVNIRWAAPGTGSVTVTQTSAFGCDSTVSLSGIVILPTPAPVISGADSTCQNKLYAYSTPAVSGHTYSWSVNGGTIEGPSTSNTVNIRWAAPGTGSVTVTQTSGFGCDSTVSLSGIIIMPTPAPVISGPDSACQNKRYTYSVPSVSGHTYSWSVNGGTVEGPSTSNTVNIRWAAPGAGIVTVTQASAFGCDSTVHDTVVIMPTPAPVISGSDSVCQSRRYTYSVAAVSGNTYSWSVSGGTIEGPSTSNTVDIRWSAVGTGSVTVTQTSTFGCDSTVSLDGIVIMPAPAPVISGPDSTCQNKRYTYSVPSVSGHTYSWSVNGGTIEGPSTSNTVDIRWAGPGAGIVTVTQASAFGCDSTVHDTVVIMPAPAPVISGSDSVCQNKRYTYSTPAVAGHTYSWSVSGGTIEGPSTSNTVDIRWAAAGTGSVTVTQTSTFGCDSTISLNGIVIMPTPAPVISGPDSTCQNKRYAYSVTAVAGHTYSWSVSGGSIEGSNTSNTVNIRWAAPGTGSVTVTQTSGFGCDSTVSLNGIVIMPTPAPVISGPDTACQNKRYTYSVPAVSGHTYSWSVSGGAIEGTSASNTVDIRWASPGKRTITVTQTSAFGCDSTIQDTIVILPTPAPVITGSDSTCENKLYTYSTPAVAAINTYSWSVSGGTIEGPSTSNTVNIRWAGPGTGSVTVTQASGFGCDSTVSLSGIVILPTPAPVISGPDSTCQNKRYTYSTPAVAGHSYSWSVSGGTIEGSSTSNAVNIRWAAPGNGSVTVTQTSAFGCDSTVSLDGIVIMPTPAPVISGSDSVCQNKRYTYSTPAVSGHTYSWSVSGGTIEGSSTSNTVDIRWAAPGTGSVTVIQTSAFGCDSTVSLNGIVIMPTPAPVISGSDSVCQNKGYTYSVTAVSGHTYSWSVSGGAIEGSSTSNTVNIRWAAPGTGSVTVTQTSGFGCDSTISLNGIVIMPTPAPVVSGPDSTCQNKAYNYSVAAVTGHTYSWSVSGGAIQGSNTGNTVNIRWAMPGQGIITITQSSAFGCDSTVHDTVNIMQTPAPVISGQDSTCQNKLYTYSVTAVSGHTYNWSVSGGTIEGPATSNTVSIRWAAPGTGSLTVTQTSGFGCDSTVSLNGIVILPTPAPVISGPDSTCQNKRYTYSTPAVAGHSYSWSVSGGTIEGPSTSNAVNIRWAAPGSGIVTVTQTSSFGCDSIVHDTVVIMPTPAPVISGSDSVCQNKRYTYSTPAVSGHTYLWSVSGGIIEGSSTSNTVNIRWATPGTGSVTVTQTSAFGCDSTISLNGIVIMPTPAPVISGSDSVCQNKRYTYSTPAVAGHSYSWSVSGGTIEGPATSNTVNIRWAAPGTGSVTVTQTSGFGCDSTISLNGIVIMPTPGPVISGPDSTCQNRRYTYSAPAVSGHTYSWSVSGGTIEGSSTSNTVHIRWATPGAGIVTVTQTSAFGCDSIVQDTVVIMPTPAPVISGSDSVCQNKRYAYSTPAVAGNTYSWSVTGGTIEGSATSNVVNIRWAAPALGTLTLTQTSGFGCDSTVSLNGIVIMPTPAPVISGVDSGCQNKRYVYSTPAVAGHTYSWSVTGGVIEGPSNTSSVQIRWGLPGTGVVTVTETSAFGCDSTVSMNGIVILPTPAPVINGADTTCQNKLYTYTTPFFSGSTYSWSVNGGTIEGPSDSNSVNIRWATTGTGTVTQTSGSNCDSTVSVSITILPTPAPVISGPDSTCQNKLYTYSVTADSGHTYSWSVSGGSIEGRSDSNIVRIRWAMPGQGIVTISQTSELGCDSIVHDTVTILQTPAPVISGPDSTCQNKRYTYSVTAVSGHAYSWSVNGGTIEGSSTSNTVNIRWAAPGSGTITLTQTSAFGCDSIVHDTVVIMPTPAPVISGPDSTCQNKRYTYSIPAVAGHAYSWSVSGGTIEGSSASNTIDVRWATPGAGILTVTQTSAFGCDSIVHDTIVIMPTPAPVVSGADSVCQNKRYTYSTPAVAGHTYSWSVNGGSIEGSTTSNTVHIRWAAPGTGTLTLTQTSAFGCDSTVSLNGIVILQTPAPVISGPDSTCQNKRYTYSVPAVSGHAYNWSVSGGSIEGPATSNTVNIRWAAPGSGSLTLTQTSAFGCDSIVHDTVVILPTPAPVISGPDSTCQNKLYAYSVAAVSGHTYSWSVTGGSIEGSTTSNTVNIRWAAAGTGSVTVTQASAFGCDSTVSLTGIVILPTPVPVISGPDSTCQNKRYTYSVPAVSGHTYSWSVNGGTIEGSSTSNTVNIRWAAPGSGIVTVTQTSAFGCDSIVHDTVVIMPTPAPVISGPDSTCQNKRYTYSVPAVAGHTYSWSVNGGSIEGSSASNTVNIRWAAPGTGTVTLTQTSAFGCDSIVHDTVVIMPTPAPVISGPDSTCQNKRYTYNVTAVSGHTYSWSVSGGTIEGSSTSNTVNIRWAAPGTGRITLTQASAFGCDSTVYDTVVIMPTPAPVISGADSVCQNKRYTYSIPAVAGHSYSWSVSGGSIEGPSTSNTVNIRWAPPGIGSLTVTQTSGFGCDSSVSLNGIVIMPTPAPVITGPDSTCQNKRYTYSVTAVSGNTYSWSVSGGSIEGSSASNTVNIRWAAPGTGTVTLTQTSAFGCDSIVHDTVVIMPTPAPVISGPDSTCQNKRYTYSVPAVSGHAYSWSVNGGTIEGTSTSNTVNIRWAAPGSGIVTLTQTSSFGCDSIVHDTVVIMPTPAPVISGPDSTCQNRLYAYSVTAVSGHAYSWSVSGGSIEGPANTSTIHVRWAAPGTGRVTVTQTSGFGCDSIIHDTVVIMPTPAPVISGPDSTCQNKLYTYSVTAVSGHAYSWSVNGGTIEGTSTSNTVNIRWAAPGAGSVTVTQTSGFGCDSTVSLNTIIILQTPAPVISGPDSACQNKRYTYSVPAISGHTYSWSVNGGTIEGPSTSNTVNVRWATPGNGRLTITQTSNFGCDSIVHDTVVIMPTPAPVITGADSVCQNKRYTYSTPAVAGHTYSWSVSGGTIEGPSTSNTVNIRWAAPGTGSVTVIQASGFGCDSTVTLNGIDILPTPAPVISGPDSTCQNKRYTYNVTAVSGHTYSWSVSGGAIEGSTTANTVNIRWAAPGTGRVTLTQTSAFGCDSIVHDTVVIMPTPAPVISGPDSTCQNKLYTYSVTAVAGNTYNWSVNGGVIQGPANTSSVDIRWAAPGSGSLTVTQASAFGCDSTVSRNVIHILPTPAPVIVGPDSTCQNKAYTYSVTAVSGNSYNWSVTGGTIQGTATSNSVNIRWAAPGTGSVTVTQTSVYGCDSTVSRNVIHILPTPAPVIAGPDSVCQNKRYTYSVTAVSGHAYSWSVNGGTIEGSSTSNTVNIRWAAPGTGRITLTQASAFGCDSTVHDTVVIMPTPAPVISGADSVCQNKRYTYSTPAVAGHSYSWSVSGGSIEGSSTSNTVNIRWASPAIGSVTVRQTSDFGCDSIVTLNGIDILPTPAPVISGPDSACQNKRYTYSTPAVSGHTYSWSVSGGTIEGSATSNTVDIRWAAPGDGRLTVRQTSAFGCDSIVHDTVVIMPTPAPVISGPDSVCQNKRYTYSTPAVSGHTYSWSVSGGTIEGSSTSNTVNVRWAAPGTGSVTVTQISSFGCDSIVSLNGIDILQTPAPVISGPDSVCQNKRYTYSTPAVAGHTYSWSVTGGSIEGPANSGTVNIRWAAPGTGSVTVTQRSSFGCDSTVSLNGIDILPTPAPVISGPDSVCQNKRYTYSTPAVAGHTYSWSVSGGTIEGSAASSTVNIRWAAPGTGVVTVRQTSAFGCDSIVSRNDIKILPTPAPVISGPDSTCQNKRYVYSAPAVSGNAYSWSVVGGTIEGSATSNTVDIRWAAPGTGMVILTQTSAFGCDSTVRSTVRILPTPAPVITGPDTVCQQSTATYTCTGTGITQVTWSVLGGTILSGQNTNTLSVLWDTAGTGIVFLHAVSPFGCDSMVLAATEVLEHFVLQINGPDTVCQRSTVTYSTSIYAGMNYLWTSFNGTLLTDPSLDTVDVFWGHPGHDSISLVYTSSNGCKGRADKPVFVHNLPDPKIEGSQKGCANTQGNPYNLNIYKAAGKDYPYLTYDWTVTSGANLSGNGNDSVYIDWGSPGVYNIGLTLLNTITGCSDTSSKIVEVGSMVKPEIEAGPDEGCVPFSRSITEKSGSPGLSYEWKLNDEVISDDSLITMNYNKPGTYELSLVVSNSYGCRDTATFTIKANPRPNADFSIVNTLPVYMGDTTRFINRSKGATSYEWRFDDGSLDLNVDSRKSYPDPGEYFVTLFATNEDGCADSITKKVPVVVIPRAFVPNAFTPNGDGNNDYFTVTTYYIIDLEVVILNRWGEIIYRSDQLDFKWDGRYMGVDCQQDVYVYIIHAKGWNNEQITLSGDVTLLR